MGKKKSLFWEWGKGLIICVVIKVKGWGEIWVKLVKVFYFLFEFGVSCGFGF